jgi:ParB family transcriptional regulator, chromosome partitioning protein
MSEDPSRPHDQRPRLGRGLAALLGNGDEQVVIEGSRGVRRVPIEFLRPNPRNPRKAFAEEALDELTNSIRERGVIQPVLARAIPRVADAYEIIAGERRWRAAQRAGHHEIPILILEAGDREALEIAIIENVQRADLNALEEANGYSQLATDHGYSHADIARIVGKSRSHIANTLRLTNLPEHTRALLTAGAISAGHARALLAVRDPDITADRVVAQRMTVREVERLSENARKMQRVAVKAGSSRDPDTRALEAKLALALGTKVVISNTGDAGRITISYRTIEQLDAICRQLTSYIT